MAIKIGSILIDIQANTAQLITGMQQAQKDVSKAFGEMKAAASEFAALIGIGFSLEGLTAFIKENIKAQVEMAHMAAAAGISNERFAELAYAARTVGVPIEALSKGLLFLERNMFAAASGNDKSAAAFKTLGVSVTDSNGKLRDTGSVFLEVQSKLAGMQDGAAKAGIAMALLTRGGRGFAELAALLRLPAESLQELMKEAEEFGLGKTFEEAEKAEQQFNRLSLQTEAMRFNLVGGLAPALAQIGNAFFEVRGKGEGFRDLGAEIGEAFKLAALGIGSTVFGVQEMMLYFEKAGIALKPFARAVASLGIIAPATFTDAEDATARKDQQEALSFQIDQIQQRYEKFKADLDKPVKGFTVPRGRLTEPPTPTLTGGAFRFQKDLFGDELQKLQETLRSSQALTAVRFEDAAAIREVTAANQADQIVTKLNIQLAEQKRKLEEEADSAAKAGNTAKAAAIRAQADKIKLLGDEAKATFTNIIAQTEEQKVIFESGKALRAKLEDSQLAIAQEDRLAVATLRSAEAIRSAGVANQLDAYRKQLEQLGVPEANREELLKRMKPVLNDVSLAQQHLNDTQKALTFAPDVELANTLDQLSRSREILTGRNRSPLFIDAAARDAMLDFDKRLEDALSKTNKIGDSLHAAFIHAADDAQRFGEHLFAAFSKAIEGLNQGLTDLAFGYKTNFSQVLKGLGKDLFKANLEKSVTGPLFGKLGELFPGIAGLEAKPDGTESNPWYVRIAGGSGLLSSVSGGGNSGSGGWGALGSIISNIFGGGSSGGGDVFAGESISSFPFLAGGGFLGEGEWGVVGENGPEFARGGRGGTSIIPPSKMKGGGDIYIDARGADAGVEMRVMRAIHNSKNQAVRESVMAVEERRMRTVGH